MHLYLLILAEIRDGGVRHGAGLEAVAWQHLGLEGEPGEAGDVLLLQAVVLEQAVGELRGTGRLPRPPSPAGWSRRWRGGGGGAAWRV
jgi:hypothetical protein